MMMMRGISKRQRLGTTIERKKMNHLPEEIMHEILSRVPAQSLYQSCRFVSKDWFNLIKDSDFVKLHHSRINIHGSDCHTIALCHSTKEQFFNLVKNNEKYHPIPTSFKALKIHLDLPRLAESQTIKLVGSANGLVCLSILPDDNLFYICNPVTREIMQLPKAPGLGPYSEKYNLKYLYPTTSGFGFHTATNTYKVVRTWFFHVKGSEGLSSYQTGIEIYNVGSGVWRWMDQLVISKILCNLNVPLLFLNEALHWEIEDFKDGGSYIGVIHIGDETFRTFEEPICGDAVNARMLCSLRQCLCLIDEEHDHNIVVWTMKQYGVVKSWNKEHVIRKEMFGSLQTVSFYMLNTMKNGIVLIDLSGKYQFYYDFEKQEFKQILIHGICASPENLQFVLHVGSLISPRSIACTNDIHQVSFAKPGRPIRYSDKRIMSRNNHKPLLASVYQYEPMTNMSSNLKKPSS